MQKYITKIGLEFGAKKVLTEYILSLHITLPVTIFCRERLQPFRQYSIVFVGNARCSLQNSERLKAFPTKLGTAKGVPYKTRNG